MPGLTSKILSVAKKMLLALVLVALLSFMYKYVMRLVRPQTKSAPLVVKDFDELDSIQFLPKVGSVIELSSDRTTDALLSGAFGPVVVVFVADWCAHCRNLSGAYEAAAAEANLPFVRVRGDSTPVSSAKYAVAGYPTILGVASVGGPPRRFASQRTKEALLQFGAALKGTEDALGPPAVLQIVQPQAAQAARAHVAQTQTAQEAQAALSVQAPAAHVAPLTAQVVAVRPNLDN